MNKEMIIGLLRHVLTFGGGYLIAKGVFDQAALDAVVPAILTLIGVAWSAFDKKTPPTPPTV